MKFLLRGIYGVSVPYDNPSLVKSIYGQFPVDFLAKVAISVEPKKYRLGGITRIKTSKTYLVYVLLSFSDKHLNWSFISATFLFSL